MLFGQKGQHTRSQHNHHMAAGAPQDTSHQLDKTAIESKLLSILHSFTEGILSTTILSYCFNPLPAPQPTLDLTPQPPPAVLQGWLSVPWQQLLRTRLC